MSRPPRPAARSTLALSALAALAVAPAAAEARPPTETLQAAWQVPAPSPDASLAALVAAGDTVLASWYQGRVTALDAETGKIRWRQQDQAPGIDPPAGIALEGEVAVVAWGQTARIEGLDVRTGAARWSVVLPNLPKGFAACERHRVGVVAVVEGSTFAGLAVDLAAGTPLWRTPVEGEIAGAGGDHVFFAVRSETGRLASRLEAVHCATGERSVLAAGERPFVTLLGADGGFAALRHFEFGFKNQRVCLHDLSGEQGPKCLEENGIQPDLPVVGGALHGGFLYLAANHLLAQNLDPTPDARLARFTVPALKRDWVTEPLVAGGSPHFAGQQILTGFGSTGAADFAYVLDPDSGLPGHRLPLKKAPEALASTATVGVVGEYGGALTGFKLPRPGATPAPRAAVAPLPEKLQAPPAAPAPDLGWKKVAVHTVHPERARTSGQDFPGQASPAIFLDAAGATVAVGGNDDKVRVVEATTGKSKFLSAGLGKDVEALHACAGGTFAARIYGGRAFVFSASGGKWKPGKPLPGKHGWNSGLTADCGRYLNGDFAQTQWLLDTRTGKFAGNFAARNDFDDRGLDLRGDLLAVRAGEDLLVLDLSDLREGPAERARIPTPGRAHGGGLTQAWLVNADLLAREYCGSARCTVELVALQGGEVRHTLAFDTRAAGWSPTVPSALDLDPSGQWLFFFRRDLPPVLVEVATNRRQPVAAIVGQGPEELTSGHFSADGRRLVLSRYPRTFQITVLER